MEGITANPEICMNHVLNSIGIVTYLNPFIGHHEGDIVGKICAQTGKNVREVVLERGLLTAEQLDEILHREPDEPAIQSQALYPRSHRISEQMGRVYPGP